MAGDILGMIASPQQIDMDGIVQAMDFRQKRLDALEQKRKEIAINNAVAEAAPNLEKGGAMHTLAVNDPTTYFLVANASGIPTNDGEAMQEFANLTKQVSQMGMVDHNAALDHVKNYIDTRTKQGVTPNKMVVDFLGKANSQDPAEAESAWRGLGVMANALNYVPPKPMTAAEAAKAEIDKGELAVKQGDLALKQSDSEWKKNHPNLNADGSKNAKVVEWEQFQNLGGFNTPEGRAFGQSAHFVSTEGREIQPKVQDFIFDSSEKANALNTQVNQYNDLAGRLSAADYSGGKISDVNSFIKNMTGQQDGVTALQGTVSSLLNSDAMAKHTKGIMTDNDFKVLRDPLPSANADPKYLATYFKAATKLLSKQAEYETFKSEFGSKHGSFRTPEGTGYLEEWNKRAQSSPTTLTGQDKPANSNTASKPASSASPKKLVYNPATGKVE